MRKKRTPPAPVFGLAWGLTAAAFYVFIVSGYDLGAASFFLNAPAALITLGGVTAAAYTAFPPSYVAGSVKSAALIFKTQKDSPGEAAARIARLADTASREGILALEGIAAQTRDSFLKKGLMLVADGAPPEIIGAAMEAELGRMDESIGGAADFWDFIAAAASAWGAMGALTGFAAALCLMDNPGAAGGSAATALASALYGALAANLFAKPAAAGLRRYSARKMMIKEVEIQGLLALRAGESPRAVEEKLGRLIPPRGDGANGKNLWRGEASATAYSRPRKDFSRAAEISAETGLKKSFSSPGYRRKPDVDGGTGRASFFRRKPNTSGVPGPGRASFFRRKSNVDGVSDRASFFRRKPNTSSVTGRISFFGGTAALSLCIIALLLAVSRPDPAKLRRFARSFRGTRDGAEIADNSGVRPPPEIAASGILVMPSGGFIGSGNGTAKDDAGGSRTEKYAADGSGAGQDTAPGNGAEKLKRIASNLRAFFAENETTGKIGVEAGWDNETGWANEVVVNETGVNETGVNETGINETGTNETGVNETGVNETGLANEVGVNETVGTGISYASSGGYIRLTIPAELAFDRGKAALKPEAVSILEKISGELKNLPDATLTIEGHADAEPINTPQFPNNWVLSSVRAVNAGLFFTERAGVDPSRVTAAGRPDAPDGASGSGRLEITIIG